MEVGGRRVSQTEALKASFVEKVRNIAEHQKARELLERQLAADYIASDPLNLNETRNAPDLGEASPKADKESRKVVQFRGKRKPPKDDIFTAFGKEHDRNDMEEYEINGVVHKRVNYKKNWQSESDLFRWRKALCDNSRNTKLMHEVQAAVHPNYQQERAELTQKHNALFRQRQHVDWSSDGGRKKNSSAQQLKELQSLIQPKRDNSRKKNAARNSEMDFMMSALFGKDKKAPLASREPRTKAEEEIINFLRFIGCYFRDLEEAFKAIDCNGNGHVSFSELSDFLRYLDYRGDLSVVFHKLDMNGNGLIQLPEWLNLKPYWLQDMIRRQPVGEEAASPGKITALAQPGAKLNSAALSGDPSGPSSPEQRSVTSMQGSASSLTLKRAATAPGNVGLESDFARSTANLSDGDAGGDSPDVNSSECSRERRRRSVGTVTTDESCQPQDAGGRGLRERSLQKCPRTMSLLIFRNADRAHAGEVVFIKKQPLTLEHLLRLCSKACWPLVAPVEQLFDSSLKPVKCLQQVHSGGTYLLKGKEGLDPPPQFFAHHPASETSLRHLNEVHQASLVEHRARPFSSTSQARTPMMPLSRPDSGAIVADRPTTSAVLFRPELSQSESSALFADRPTTSALLSRPEFSRPESGSLFADRPTTSAVLSRPESGTSFLSRPTTSVALSRPTSGAMMARQSSASDAGAAWPKLSSIEASAVQSLCSSRVGSPPQQPRGARARAADKWEINPWLAMRMSYGGLVFATKHHNYDQWSQVQLTQARRSKPREESGPFAALNI